MTTLDQTAYPRLKSTPTKKELDELYTPTAAERALVFDAVQRPLSRLAVLIHLKVYQRLGFFTTLSAVPDPIKSHIAMAAGFQRMPPAKQLNDYDTSGAKRDHIQLLRHYLSVRVIDAAAKEWLIGIAERVAEIKQALPDIINVMLEELVHHRYELPGFTTLERIAINAREKVNERYFQRINELLTPPAKKLLDGLFQMAPDAHVTRWQQLKQEPKQPTQKHVRLYLQQIRYLQQLAIQLPVIDIPIPKLKQFRAMARALDASEVLELKASKRYALAVIFVRAQYSRMLDDAADLFIRLVQNLDKLAQQKLLDYQSDHTKRTDTLIEQLKEVLLAFQLEGSDTQKVDAIHDVLLADIDVLLAECDEHMAYAGKNYLPFLLQPYGTQRSSLLNCLDIMCLRTSSQDKSVERLIAAVLALRNSRTEWIDLKTVDLDLESDLNWLSAPWRKLIFKANESPTIATQIHRKYFELAALQLIKEELRSGDLFVDGGERYDDYREQLVDDVTMTKELQEYEQVTGVLTDAKQFVHQLKSELTSMATNVDRLFPDNAHAELVDGRLVLKRSKRPEVSKAIITLDKILTERMPDIGILDILVDTEKWLKLHRDFRPIAGTESRLDELMSRVVTTLFCYGCNLGPTQTSRSIKSFSRRQIAWLNLKYVTEELLDQAVVKVINAYNRFELPAYWGNGKRASADGTKWSVYEQNLLTEYHIRYGGYGGIGYYHVSDTYIALYCRFISCGAYEGHYIFDGLMANSSDIQPDTVHGDTQAQNYPAFALAHLLGIKLMPRIRNIKDLTFHRPDGRVKYKHLDAIFGAPVDWKMIETHLHDMLRVAVSIKLGKITASTILRRLGTYSKKNKLYFAFKELGKAIRTMFLLRYISDIDIRNEINAATNKSEEFNGFIKWVFFGGEGIIAENIRHEQSKIAKYSHLVANMIILHNVDRMTRILAELKSEGMELDADVLAGLSPYRYSHINRFGDYTLDFDREELPLEHSTKILN